MCIASQSEGKCANEDDGVTDTLSATNMVPYIMEQKNEWNLLSSSSSSSPFSTYLIKRS
jgi:hypothetical protein